ncbi:sensor histidine kinase [Streptomyces lunaelactis]|uniref:sensor histidine kinase n=1 Tax=Streptomyces lunaelactis TaxID=1535768 RepID=UPI0015859650|nr:sensor histidine kinase [Streptomyces lunaelactis]NUK06556.1 sensor histidine kinase [Streptomyces lunaelactis]NUK75218.1 sensor histidine kinase [Streptomyces lunaelactis]NUK81319.1 sensor histidine kinase [Streptomyces lunaelactis]NUL14909.1 sensor histidine kinase [Streptomyces lunaelactis]NUL26898.1 sensor histidine kinase [Streptomyces lunaelactis]
MKAPQETPQSLLAESLAWCSGIAYVVLLYVVVLNTGRELTGMRLLLAAMLAVLLLPLVLRRPLPALVLLLTASFAATVRAYSAMAAGHGLTSSMPIAETQAWQIAYLQALLTDLTVGWIAATRPRLTAAVAALVALGVQIGGASYYREGSSSFLAASAFLALMTVTAWTVGYSVRERRQHTAALRARAAEQAVTAERLRIARELHDMVAHSIGVIAIQAGVGRRVIDTQPSEARNALAAIEGTSRDTLAGLRRMLGALRQADPGDGAPLGPAPVLADLDGLVERIRDAGVRVDIEWRGERRPLPPEIELSAYRIIQEAITNVVRHSNANACRVSVDCGEDDLSIEITDEGRGLSGLPGAADYGLTGMRERAALLHGEFTAGPRIEGGFRVAARLPVPAAVT